MSILGFRLPAADAVALPPEIAFLLSEGFDLERLASAVEIARASGTDAATALLATGLIGEETYYRALARALGAVFLDREIPLGPGARFPESLIAGVAPLAPGGPAAFVLAPRGSAVTELLAGRSPTGRIPAITSPSALHAAIFAAHPSGIAAFASDELRVRRPDWAFQPGLRAPHLTLAGLALAAASMLALSLPASLTLAGWTLAQFVVLAMVTFRLGAVNVESGIGPTTPPARLANRDLPVYTVLVALHREASVVPRLVEALSAFDYPIAKTDIKLVIEADDATTAAALAAIALPARFEVVVVPPGLPRTKPGALNVALPLARGSCLVVYDAEDVPDPGQLRVAAQIFARSPPDTACLQGRLVIDNMRDSWLTGCFALEYAALFDVLGPALAQWRLPTPLGGTSTHFRTHVLRAVHGWDAWNVTEDADLGMRLARAGYHVGDLPSSTMEEAPDRVRPWLRQRTRWMKGFLQTTVTHGRRPLDTMRQLGPLGTVCAIALVPGTVASALAYPFLMVPAFVTYFGGDAPSVPGFWSNLPTGTAITVFASGFAAMLLPALLGCVRRRWWDLLVFVPFMPVYFVLVSLAAWLGLIEFFCAPARWNKTEHGLSRTSRSGALPSRSDPLPPRAEAPQRTLARSAALCSVGRIRFSALMNRLRRSMM